MTQLRQYLAHISKHREIASSIENCMLEISENSDYTDTLSVVTILQGVTLRYFHSGRLASPNTMK